MNSGGTRLQAADFPEMDLALMRSNAKAASRLLKLLANENRLLILCALVEGESSVSGLNQKIQLSQSALSQHLALLREQGLVVTRREAQTIYYALAQSRALPIIETLHEIYCE